MVRSLQKLNEKLQTTQVSISRRMATMEYYAAVKTNKQQWLTGMLMTLRKFLLSQRNKSHENW